MLGKRKTVVAIVGILVCGAGLLMEVLPPETFGVLLLAIFNSFTTANSEERRLDALKPE